MINVMAMELIRGQQEPPSQGRSKKTSRMVQGSTFQHREKYLRYKYGIHV